MRDSSVALGIVAVVAVLAGCSPNEDSGATTSEESNTAVHPSSPFAGVEACRECHSDRVSEYKKTPHFRTLRTPTTARPIAPFASKAQELTTRNPDLKFQMTERPDGFHVTAHQNGASGRRTIDERVDLIIGSGRIFEGYLSFDGNALFQIPVGYFAAGERWANCPGYEDGTADFSRTIGPRCIDCHGTWARVLPSGPNHFVPDSILPGLACERCHGSGHGHIAHHRAHPDDDEAKEIVMPATLPAERRLDLCGQCHGDPGTLVAPAFTYQPGTPLEDYVLQDKGHGDASFVHTANQVQRLAASACFEKTHDIDCTDCHNPHRFDPAALREATLDACVRCHKANRCGKEEQLHEALRPQCIACHMPSKSAIMTTLSERTDDYQDVVRLADHSIGIHVVESDAVQLRFRIQRGLGGTTVLAARVIAAYERGYDEQIRTGSLIEALSYARKLSQLGAPGAKESLARARQLQALRLRIDALIQTALTTSGVARNRLMRSASELHLSQPMSAGSRALVALSGHYIDEGRTNEALAACDRAELILDPSDKKVLIDLHAHRGAAQLASGNIKESLESLQAAHSMAPQHKTAARDLARAYLALSKVRKAMLIIEQRTEANPESTEWLNLLGQAQVQMGRIDEGVATLYASLAVDGTQAQVHLALGEILAERGEKLAAREHLTQVVKLGAARGLTLMKARAEGILRRL